MSDDHDGAAMNDAFTGVPRKLRDQYFLADADADIKRIEGPYEKRFEARVAQLMQDYAQAGRRAAGRLVGDPTGRRVAMWAEGDGLGDIPAHQWPQRPPHVAAVIDSVGRATASICEHRQRVASLLDQEVVNASRDQGAPLPQYERRVGAVQRSLLVVMAGPMGWAFAGVARRVNEWPIVGATTATRALDGWAVWLFSAVVITLGLVTGVLTSSATAGPTLDRLRGMATPRRVVPWGAALCGAFGAICATGGMWRQDPVQLARLLAAAGLWAALGAVGFAIVHLATAVTQNPEIVERIATLFGEGHTRRAEKQEEQARAALDVVGPMHDAMQEEARRRAQVLVAHYYRINLLVRRTSRNEDLETFVRTDLEQARQEIEVLGARPCTCP